MCMFSVISEIDSQVDSLLPGKPTEEDALHCYHSGDGSDLKIRTITCWV